MSSLKSLIFGSVMFFILSLMGVSQVWAQDSTVKNESSESEDVTNLDRMPAASSELNDQNLAIKVKKKMYPGGADEGDLKVQVQLVNPTRRFAPVQNQDPEAHEPASND